METMSNYALKMEGIIDNEPGARERNPNLLDSDYSCEACEVGFGTKYQLDKHRMLNSHMVNEKRY